MKKDILNTMKKKEDNILGRVIKLACLVDYQKGSIVSRTIIDKETGTVTVFAFDKGQHLSEHTAPFDALVYIIDGSPEIFIDKKPHYPKAGDILIMPANKPHALRAENRFKILLVMIKK